MGAVGALRSNRRSLAFPFFGEITLSCLRLGRNSGPHLKISYKEKVSAIAKMAVAKDNLSVGDGPRSNWRRFF